MTERDRGEGSFEVDLQAADDLAAAAIREGAAAPPPVVEPEATAGRRTGPIVVVICLAIVASQLPALRSSFKTPPSIRIGATDGDPDTEACIETLWKISSMLQFGSFRQGTVLEPMTNRPYLVHESDSDTIVACPNPGAHSLRSLHVSAAHRAPEAKK